MRGLAHDRLLVLDLDETLIYGTEVELDRPADFVVGPFKIYRRPYLDEFLSTVFQLYAVAVWSSATLDYASEIAHRIRPDGVTWQFVWGRERCVQRMHCETYEIVFLKDIKKIKRLGWLPRHVLMVDDSPGKLSRNYGNAVYVRPYEGSLADAELSRLAAYLKSIRDAENYRKIEKRGWRTLEL